MTLVSLTRTSENRKNRQRNTVLKHEDGLTTFKDDLGNILRGCSMKHSAEVAGFAPFSKSNTVSSILKPPAQKLRSLYTSQSFARTVFEGRNLLLSSKSRSFSAKVLSTVNSQASS
jgi:hypothetical protein